MAETRQLKIVILGNARQGQSALRAIQNESDRTGSKVGGFGAKMGATFAKVGKSAALGLAGATAAGAVLTYKVGAPYEQALNKIEVLTGTIGTGAAKTRKALESQSGTFAQMGMDVGQAASGVIELAKSGLSLDKSLKAVNATMVLAKAGELGVAEASALVSNTLNTFHMKASQAGDIANVLANAANISSADVTDLAQTLKYVAPVASAAGVSLHTTAGMMAILANNGIKGTNAGTGLRNLLLSLEAPTVRGGNALEDLGVDVFNAAGKMRPIGDVLEDLRVKLGRVKDQGRKTDLLKSIFGKEGITSAQSLISAGGKGIDDATKGVGKAGAAAKLAASASRGLSGAVAMALANLRTLGQETYMAFAPLLTKVLTPVAAGIGKLGRYIIPAKNAIVGLFSSFKGGGGSGALSTLFGSLKKFGAALLPTVKQLASTFMDHLRPAISSIGALLANDLIPAIKNFLPVITPVVKFLLKIVGGALIGAFDGIVKVVKGVIKIVSGLMNVISGIFTGNWSRVWQGIKQIFSGALQGIIGALQTWMNVGVLGIFKKGGLKAAESVKGLWSKVKGLFTRGVELVKGALKNLVRIITAPYRKAFGLAVDFVKTGWRFIKGDFTGGVGGIKAALGRLWQVITYPFTASWNTLKSLVPSMWNGVKNAFSNGVSGAVGFLKSLPGKIKALFSNAKTLLLQAGKDIVQGIINGIKSMAGKVTGPITDIGNKISGAFKSVMSIFSPSRRMAALAKFVTLGIAKGLMDAPSVKAVEDAITRIGAKIVNAFKHGVINSKQKDRLLELLRNRNAAIVHLVKQRLKLQDKLDAAQKVVDARMAKLQGLRDTKSTLVDAVRSSISDLGNVTSLISTDDGVSNSPAAIIARFSATLDRIKNFKKNWEFLRDHGIGNRILNQIAAAGPDEGGAIAQALAGASGPELAQIQSLSNQYDAIGTSFSQEAGSIYNAQISAAQGRVNAAQQIVNHIKVEIKGNVTAEKDLARSIAHTVRDEITRINKRAGKKD